jgi:hypothetical protein
MLQRSTSHLPGPVNLGDQTSAGILDIGTAAARDSMAPGTGSFVDQPLERRGRRNIQILFHDFPALPL